MMVLSESTWKIENLQAITPYTKLLGDFGPLSTSFLQTKSRDWNTFRKVIVTWNNNQLQRRIFSWRVFENDVITQSVNINMPHITKAIEASAMPLNSTSVLNRKILPWLVFLDAVFKLCGNRVKPQRLNLHDPCGLARFQMFSKDVCLGATVSEQLSSNWWTNSLTMMLPYRKTFEDKRTDSLGKCTSMQSNEHSEMLYFEWTVKTHPLFQDNFSNSPSETEKETDFL